MKILFIACYSPLINNSASIETLQYLNNLAKIDENEVMTLKEVKALRKEMARIKEENEILKKAMAIFATRN